MFKERLREIEGKFEALKIRAKSYVRETKFKIASLEEQLRTERGKSYKVLACNEDRDGESCQFDGRMMNVGELGRKQRKEHLQRDFVFTKGGV